eukprot:m.48876 g.48876  ORF g.48876 m.48876 type:complete len:129 (+) comp8933_c0_seq2:6186-6572(+)
MASEEDLKGFQWCCSNGDLEAAKAAIETKGLDVNGELTTGRRPIHYAADSGHTAVVEYLISKGADVNLEDKHGITAVLAAIWEGHVETVKLLLEKGAKKDGKAPGGESYLESADTAEKNQAELKALLK